MIVSPIAEIYRRFHLKEQLIDWFAPLPYQVKPYLSTAKIQFAEGSNRTGKTELWIAKGIQINRGKHPTVKPKLPVKGRIIATVLTEGALGTILNKLKKLLPVKELLGGTWDKGLNKERMIVTFKNGSTIQLMADTQDVQQHRSEDLDWVIIDEECREEIYDENYTRCGDRNGIVMIGATPHKGLTWSYKRLVKRYGMDPDIDYFHYEVKDNYLIDIENHLINSAKHLTEREFKIRIKGQRIALEGLVYYMFEDVIHVCRPFKLPINNTQLVLGVDFGYNNPHAGSLRAITDNGMQYTIDEYYESGYTVEENGKRMGTWLKDKWGEYTLKYIVCDARSGLERNSQTGLRDVDIFRKAFCDAYGKRVLVRLSQRGHGSVEHRITMVSRELLPNEKGEPKLKFFNNCFHHFNELEGYVYKKRRDEELNNLTKPKEAYDHLMNAMEYISETQPRYSVITKARPLIYQYERVGR